MKEGAVVRFTASREMMGEKRGRGKGEKR